MGAMIVVGIVYLFWVLPTNELQNLKASLEPKAYLELRNTTRTGLAQAIGGTAILLGLFFSWRNIKATERNLETSHETAARNLAIAQEGQITERFTRAIEQLGSDKLQIRLGGIYGLERIARDSKQDHWPVVEILTAFVRANSRTQSITETPTSREPPTDIQAVLTVLSRRKIEFEKESDERIDLRGANLQGANLIECHLDRAILWEIDLTEANLRDVHLESAGLSKACLDSAALTLAHLERATLGEANLESAVCSGAHMENAQFGLANLRSAKLYDANLSGANLFGADLTEASLLNANLSGAILKDAKLNSANLKNADLTDTIGLTIEQVRSARNYQSAKLPSELSEIVRREDLHES